MQVIKTLQVISVGPIAEHNIRLQNWLAILVNIGSIASIEMYRKSGQPKSNLIGRWLKLVWKWPVAKCYLLNRHILIFVDTIFFAYCSNRYTNILITNILHVTFIVTVLLEYFNLKLFS